MLNLKIVDGKYFIKDRKLGAGSFAVTYITVDGAGEVLACKMIEKKKMLAKITAEQKDGKKGKDYLIQQLKNEVKTWKQLTHPNIVRFIDFSETQNNIYFFLEYCEQGHLDDFIKRHTHIPEPEALRLMAQIAEGLLFLYERGIFHRDIKPENILIHRGEAKIADFGFAKVIEEAELKDNPRDWTKVGTPLYMSPQILFGQPYTIKCDVWSMGLVFYKMLYGILPWSCPSLDSLKKSISTKVAFPPSIKVSFELKALLSSMLEVDEAARVSIRELIKGLRGISDLMDIE
jgi:serine/threonine protein kinase